LIYNKMEKLLLSNGEYYQNMSNSFKSLLTDQNFSDVTLVCEGYKQVKAHKFILSAHSPVFNEILLKSPHQHPLVYLSGINHEDLQALVRFLYLGETKVKHEHFSSFLKFSREFEIEGLANLATEIPLLDNSDLKKEMPNSLDKESCFEGRKEHSKRIEPANEKNLYVLDGSPIETEMEESLPCIEEFLNNLNETYEADLHEVNTDLGESNSINKYVSKSENQVPKESYLKSTNVDKSKQAMLDYDVPTEQLMVKELSCDKCDYSADSSDDLNSHKSSSHTEQLYPCSDCRKRMESEEGIFYPCTSCTLNLVKEKKKEKVLKFKCDKCDYKAGKINHLTQHKQSKHMNVVYSCDKCDYKASMKGNLSQHKQAEHEGIRYSCKVCGYEAKKMGHLIQHKKVKHIGF